MRVLVVEDHKELAATIAVGPRREGMAVDIAHDGRRRSSGRRDGRYDVVVLDRDLPGFTATRSAGRSSRAASRARVLMLTAADTIENRVDGLGLGADDYLPKPFAFAELVARIRALARRSPAGAAAGARRGDIRLDTAQRVATRGGRRLELSPKELAVLELLLAADGAPLSAEQLLERAWDEYVDSFSNVVKVTISRLRRKLGEPPAIETVPGRLPDRRMSAAPGRMPRRLSLLPRRTIRLRLTLLFGALFLVSGAALLAVTYVLVDHQFTANGASFFVTRGTESAVRARVSVVLDLVSGSGARGGRRGLRRRLRTAPTPGRASDAHAAVERGAARAARRLGDRARDHGGGLDLARLARRRARAPAAAHDHARGHATSRRAASIAASRSRPRRRAHTARQHLRRPARPARGLVRGAAPVRRQRLARAAHPAHARARARRGGARRSRPTVASLRATCEQVLAAGEQQERLIEALLTLSRSQRGLDRHEPVDLAAIAARAHADRSTTAALRVATHLEPAWTGGDPRLVERSSANLLDQRGPPQRPGRQDRRSAPTSARRTRDPHRVENSGPRPRATSNGSSNRSSGSQRAHARPATGSGSASRSSRRSPRPRRRSSPTPTPEGGLQVEVSFPGGDSRSLVRRLESGEEQRRLTRRFTVAKTQPSLGSNGSQVHAERDRSLTRLGTRSPQHIARGTGAACGLSERL